MGIGAKGFSGDSSQKFKEKVKLQEIVNLLNQDITGEIEAILIYMRNVFIIRECPASHEMEEIGKDEMRHVEWLANLISKYGGIPSMEHRELDFGGNTAQDFLKRAIELEKKAIAQYENHIKKIDHKEMAEVLQVILWEEKKHLKEFKELLENSKKNNT